MDYINEKYRIIETQGTYNNNFHIEEKIDIKNTWVHELLGYKPSTKWVRLKYRYYTCVVNRQYEFQSKTSYNYYSYSSAREFLDLYVKYLDAKPVEYKGKKFKPMLYYENNRHYFVYYEPKSYLRVDNFDFGYRNFGELYKLKKRVDEKEEEGKLVKIHKV